MVLQEEQPQAYGNSSSLVLGSGHGGAGRGTGKHRPTKQPKQKKTPQRGLGVAQLERIRLEEQQKDAATTFAASSSSLAFSPGRAVPLPALPRAMTPFSTASDLNSAGSPPVPIPPNPFPDLFIPAPTLPLSGSTVASRANSTGHELLWNPLESSPGDVESRDIVFRVSQRRQQQQLLEQHLRKSSVRIQSLDLMFKFHAFLPPQPPRR
uniref:Leucine-rich repeat and calponin y domain-containing protein 2 n=1 Tax=Anthurium amnicola TaxID=1678845 RepID=A0A1D1ZID5_9ARAE